MPPARYLELDLFRTLAVICMIAYHAAFDLAVFYGWDIDLSSTGWTVLQRGTAGLFILLVGISFAISWDRQRARSAAVGARHAVPLQGYPRKYLRRGLGLLGCAMLVTLATYAVDPHTYVRFGILHLIGVTILLLPLFAPLRLWNAAIGFVILAMASIVQNINASTSLFLPLGIRSWTFRSVDYFPLVPWLGIALIGYALGNLIYVRHKSRRERYRIGPRSAWMEYVLWPGRHALVLYLIHQPILLAIFTMTLGWPN